MSTDWKALVSEEIVALVEWLISRGHSTERAVQIAGNHPAAVRAEMADAQKSLEGVSDAEKEKAAASPEEERPIPEA